MTIEEIFKFHGTDKYEHGYAPEYERHFGPLLQLPLKILEIGVYEGASLKSWQDIFPYALITGIDINEKYTAHGPRITMFKGDQSDHNFLSFVNKTCGPFDIIIDDGGHVQSEIETTFYYMFSRMTSAGIYAIEDIGTSYQVEYGGTNNLVPEKPNAREMIRSIVEDMHREFWMGPEFGCIVNSIHVSKELVFIYRK